MNGPATRPWLPKSCPTPITRRVVVGPWHLIYDEKHVLAEQWQTGSTRHAAVRWSVVDAVKDYCGNGLGGRCNTGYCLLCATDTKSGATNCGSGSDLDSTLAHTGEREADPNRR